MTKHIITHASLVYQGGIANVFDTSDLAHTKRLMQHAFSACEYFAKGLEAAGVQVTTLYCNKAGDIIDAQWFSPLDDAPFSDKFSPAGQYTR